MCFGNMRKAAWRLEHENPDIGDWEMREGKYFLRALPTDVSISGRQSLESSKVLMKRLPHRRASVRCS